MACKIIVVGAINGQFEIFQKLKKLHEKQQFSFGLILGDFFASTSDDSDNADLSALLSGLEVPFPTYFALATRSLPLEVQNKLDANDGELCTNLFFLGKRSVTKTSEGIRIVNLAGTIEERGQGPQASKYAPIITEADIKSLHGAQNAHILLTTPMWPANVRRASKIETQAEFVNPTSNELVSNLCTVLKPLYFFSTSGFFFEREPFHHSSEALPDLSHVTRFISLAPHGNAQKQKSLYAFSLVTQKPMNGLLPPGTTSTPFQSLSTKRPPTFLNEQTPSGSHYASKRRKGRKQAPPGPETCFLCLSNPSLATHLITSIGSDCYLTTAKGPLSTEGASKSLGFPCHMLIIPLSHSPTMASIMPLETRATTYSEMTKYRTALQMLVSKRSIGKLGAITWEISRSQGVHVHWQFLPIDAQFVRNGLLEVALQVDAENARYPSFKEQDIGDGSQHALDSLRIWLWADTGRKSVPGTEQDSESDGALETIKHLVLDISDVDHFDLQFPRRVAAKLLQVDNKGNWKDCTQNQEDETKDADAFKAAFKEFEFS